jgi:threonine/homoserine/homoserine lactone efflux protein
MIPMLALVTIFFSSFVVALSGAMMPGPLLTATISESTRHGAKAGPLLILGHGILELLLVTALLLGLAPFLRRDSVFTMVAVAGAIILLWMAATMFRSLPGLRVEWEAKSPVRNHLVVSGMLLSLANPYWTIWWVSIGLGYILYSRQFGYPGVFFFFLGHIAADLAWYAMVSFVVGRGRCFFSDHLYRAVIGTCATFLLLFAGYCAWSGLRMYFL